MRTAINTTYAAKPIGPYSQAITAGNLLFVTAQYAEDPLTGKLITHTIEAETKQVMENIKAILAEAGIGFNNVVKCSIFLKNMQDYKAVNAVYGSYLASPFPARETIEVAGLPGNVNIEISLIAVME